MRSSTTNISESSARLRLKYSIAKSIRTMSHYLDLMVEHDLYYGYRSGFDRVVSGECGKPLAIALARSNKIPIGICIRTEEPSMCGCDIGVFVSKKFRRQGIGSKLIALTVGATSVNYKNKYFPWGFPKK